MLVREHQASFLFGGNAPYVEEQYEQYLAIPSRSRTSGATISMH